MVSMDLGGGQRLELEPDRDAVRMAPAVAGAQLELRLRFISAGDRPVTGRFTLAAEVYVSRLSQQGRRLLCRVQAHHLVTPSPRGAAVCLVGQVGDDQLRVVEELRAGGDLWVALTLSVSTVAGDPPTPTGWISELTFPLRAGEWTTQLETIEAAAFVEVLLPMPSSADLAGAVRRIREAQRLLRDNEIDGALVAARKALEPVLEAARDGGLYKGAAGKPARERDLPERFAVLIESTFSLLSGAAHDDAVTAGFRYTRDEAAALVATTAGLVKRLAASRA